MIWWLENDRIGFSLVRIGVRQWGISWTGQPQGQTLTITYFTYNNLNLYGNSGAYIDHRNLGLAGGQ